MESGSPFILTILFQILGEAHVMLTVTCLPCKFLLISPRAARSIRVISLRTAFMALFGSLSRDTQFVVKTKSSTANGCRPSSGPCLQLAIRPRVVGGVGNGRAK
ncbi:hypothetical protein PoB_000784500 [Plakobranchus ocellatus]|uniref:Secreted protein n=1 Tax=Plakobranchus ocellatus TaxID=259542 RepID=A0AAV3YFT0_9GAST|nr:hypothetical protein PoB_000784500 [Plakobranchus ocellatus]